MKKNIIWLIVSCLMVATLVLVSCAQPTKVEPPKVWQLLLEFTGSTDDRNWYKGTWFSPTFTPNLQELGASKSMGTYAQIVINVNDGSLVEESGARVELMQEMVYNIEGEHVLASEVRRCYQPCDFDPKFIGFREPRLSKDGRGLPMPTTSGKEIDIWQVERARLLREESIQARPYPQLFETNYHFEVTKGRGVGDNVLSWTIKVFVAGVP